MDGNEINIDHQLYTRKHELISYQVYLQELFCTAFDCPCFRMWEIVNVNLNFVVSRERDSISFFG